MEPHTDLAVEVREQYEEDNVEISGVSVRSSRYRKTNIIVTKVHIMNKNGAKKMGKPKGKYITIESPDMESDDEIKDLTASCLAQELSNIMSGIISGKKEASVFVAGLGNREVTPDMLGPLVTDNLYITRHIYNEYGEEAFAGDEPMVVSAIAPGVMAQTGIEAAHILKGIVSDMSVDCMIVIDALASRSVSRLNTTIQITDTGICPGSGVGNHRMGIDRESMGVPVIAVGVPTVVDAFTIINDSLRKHMGNQGYDDETISDIMKNIDLPETENMIVTPKNIDEAVRSISEVIAKAMNILFTNWNNCK